jgi:CHAD domain-containing protein
MPYVVDVNRPLYLEFRQAVTEQLESARHYLQGEAPSDSERAIHEFRKATKRLRAVLRLLEGTAPSKSVRSARRRLAKMARQLAEPRELSVVQQTLGNI